MVSRVDDAVKDFDHQFEKIMIILREQGERAGDIVRYLTFRLDFNEHYSEMLATKQARARAAAASDGPGSSFGNFSNISTINAAANATVGSPSNISFDSVYKGVDDTFASNVSSLTASSRNSMTATVLQAQQQYTNGSAAGAGGVTANRVSASTQLRNSLATSIRK
jgi:hypothetical protein